MSLSNETATVTYDGNNSNATGYEIPFVLFEHRHLMVTVADEAGEVVELVLDSGFRVVLDEETGVLTVVTTDPVPDTCGITIARRMPLTQTHEFVEGQRIPMGMLERSFDRIVMQAQWLWTHFTRLVSERPTFKEMDAAIEVAKLPPGFDSWPQPPIEITAPPVDEVVATKEKICVDLAGQSVSAGENLRVYLLDYAEGYIPDIFVPVDPGDDAEAITEKIYNVCQTNAPLLVNYTPGFFGTRFYLERKTAEEVLNPTRLIVSGGAYWGPDYTRISTVVAHGNPWSFPGTNAIVGQLAILTMPESGNKYTFIAQGVSPMRWGGVTSGLIHDAELPGWKILQYTGSGVDRTTEHVAIH